jgi:outer membrane biosynthesis protein TonB
MQPAPQLKAETLADAKPLDATIPELKIPEPVQKKVAPPPPPKPPEVKKEAPKPATPSFDAILKNLTKQKVQEPTDQPPVPNVKTPPRRASGAQVALADKLTASQLDALAQQLRRCWSIPAGVKDAQEMVVDIDVTVNPDRTLASAQIDDAGRAASDPAFRAAAMAAMRALRMPECTPLELPPDKYNEWQSMTLHFDPKEMLGQ